ncbi:MAG: sigma-54 dependent transcriptional regulator [bacterium]
MDLLIHIIDDDDLTCNVLEQLLIKKGHRVVLSRTGEEALDKLQQVTPDLVLLDLSLPDINGIDVLKRIQLLNTGTPIVMISGYGTIEIAVEALKLGAWDFMTKPLNMTKVTITVDNLLNHVRLEKELQQIRNDQHSHFLSQHLIGKNPVVQKCYSLARSAAGNDQMTVLICGESGTGKEFLARYIHYHSPRRTHPLVTVNCSALPKDLVESELFGYEKGAFTGASASGKRGRFELADDGTLLLDEIGDLHLEAQAKILRFLQEKELQRVGSPYTRQLNVRILAATNRNLEERVQKGLFREDLYYRLDVMRIQLPPLRHRKEDIPLFAMHFIQIFNREFGKRLLGMSPGVEKLLLSYDWPGNIRELKNIIERTVHLARGSYLTEEQMLIDQGKTPGPIAIKVGRSHLTLREAQREYARNLLDSLSGNKSQAAKILQISRSRLRRILTGEEATYGSF